MFSCELFTVRKEKHFQHGDFRKRSMLVLHMLEKHNPHATLDNRHTGKSMKLFINLSLQLTGI